MTVWCHQSTILKRYYALRIAGLVMLFVALITTVFLTSPVRAVAGINQTLSFQGRLLTNTGGVVADGYYNIEFNIYQDGDGAQAGNAGGTGGALKWTETYINNGSNSGVQVKNGFFSVSLGSKTPFGTSVDWNQDTLWLSMNIAGNASACTTFGSAPCSDDGEMLPMKRLTATPFALNSAKLEGLGADGFIKNQTSQQTGDFNISGTGMANTLQGNTSLITPLLDSTVAGNLNIGTVAASTITIGTAADGASQTINIGTGYNSSQINIGNDFATGGILLQGGSQGVRVESGGGFAVFANATQTNAFTIGTDGSTSIDLGTIGSFKIGSSQTSQDYLTVTSAGNVGIKNSAILDVESKAIFQQGITLQNTQGYQTYVTPLGYNMNTLINIPNFAVPNYGSIIAFGLPDTSSSTARGILVADARSGAHQATIGVLSPDENNIMGFSWDGSNTTGRLSTTGNMLALQGGGVDIMTARNSSGSAKIGIGNDASAGYALDVTGDTNTSSQYRINGSTALTGSSLAFSDAGTPTTITTAASSVAVNVGGGTRTTFNSSNVQIGDGDANTGDLTLFTLDQATAAPGSSPLGSMYYDTTLGKVQCYQASGWGACGNSPDTFVTLSPEYSNAVMNAAGIGTITSDFCSNDLSINTAVCNTRETYNYYGWNSAETADQTRSIYVTYQLPSTFKNFVEGSTSIMGRTDGTDATVAYQLYKSHGASGLTACSTALTVSNGAQSFWQKNTAATTDDPANCSFEAGDSILIRIDLKTKNNKNAYVSNLNFAFSNQ